MAIPRLAKADGLSFSPAATRARLRQGLLFHVKHLSPLGADAANLHPPWCQALVGIVGP